MDSKRRCIDIKKIPSVKDAVSSLLATPLSDKRIAHYKSKGIDLDDEQYTMLLEMIMGQVKLTQSNANAFNNVVSILRETEIENQVRTFELPASVMGKAFVDINRSITNREYREYLLRGGRYSLKSSFSALKIVELIKANADTHALIVRKVKNTLRDSVFAQIKWAISELNDEPNWHATTNPMQITYKPTGQTIFFRGGDEPEKIKSIKPPFGHIAFVWFEEADQFSGDEDIRNILQSAIRGGDDAIVIKSYNEPRTRAHWISKYAMQDKPNMTVHHSTYLDAPKEWVGAFALEEAEILKELNPKAYQHELLGEAVGDGGQIFENVTLREISNREIDTFEYIYHGQDWGWFPDPNHLAGMSYDANRRILYIFREHRGNKISNERWADIIEYLKGWTIVADSAEPKSIRDFKSMDFDMRGAIKGPNSVHEGIKWLQSLNEIVIDPKRCPNTAREFMGYEYERDKEGNPITAYPDRDNHSIDAVRYAMEIVWKRRGL